jgi:membrane protease YdiL (CAAX protease family)
MAQKDLNVNNFEIPIKALLPFLLITFLLAWGILFMYIFLTDQMTSLFGQLTGNHPLFFLAVYAPAISTFIILFTTINIRGIQVFFRRFLMWRTSLSWYIFLIIGMPIIFYLGSMLNGNLFINPFPFESLVSLSIAILLSIIKGPVEEIGWRGFALPLLQKKLKPFWASIFLGVVWGLWHLPAFLLSGTQQSSWAFFPFFLGTIVISLIMTSLYNESKGSILLAAFMHFQLMNPIWPEAQPYDTYLLAIAAIVIVMLKREMMFGGKNAVTDVIPKL